MDGREFYMYVGSCDRNNDGKWEGKKQLEILYDEDCERGIIGDLKA